MLANFSGATWLAWFPRATLGDVASSAGAGWNWWECSFSLTSTCASCWKDEPSLDKCCVLLFDMKLDVFIGFAGDLFVKPILLLSL